MHEKKVMYGRTGKDSEESGCGSGAKVNMKREKSGEVTNR